jgi:uncharacterized lipoprotein
MEEKKYDVLKVLGIIGATALILFGSFQNIWRTVKLAWDRVIKE